VPSGNFSGLTVAPTSPTTQGRRGGGACVPSSQEGGLFASGNRLQADAEVKDNTELCSRKVSHRPEVSQCRHSSGMQVHVCVVW
jgi:hypothetical protein